MSRFRLGQRIRFEHPVALGSFRSWICTTTEGGGIALPYLLKFLFVCLCTLLTSPFRGWERIRYGARKRVADLPLAPVFIIGHWRSGTTHLHNLLAQDEQFCFLSTFQAMTPEFCLSGSRWLKPVLAWVAKRRYPTRLIDNVPLAFDAPQEDEFAMACMSSQAFIHAFSFPKRMAAIFERHVLMDQQPQSVRDRWVGTYERLLRTIALQGTGRTLLLKNCANSGRIRILLDRFPTARFIHIHRNPYEVFLSTQHMHRTVLGTSQMQSIEDLDIRDNVLRNYEELIRHLITVREEISSNRIVEVPFDALEREPLEQLERIYRVLELDGFRTARPQFERYLKAVSGYQKNEYDLDDVSIDLVNRHWAFAFEALGYDRVRSIR